MQARRFSCLSLIGGRRPPNAFRPRRADRRCGRWIAQAYVLMRCQPSHKSAHESCCLWAGLKENGPHLAIRAVAFGYFCRGTFGTAEPLRLTGEASSPAAAVTAFFVAFLARVFTASSPSSSSVGGPM